jgi:CHAT domain-containing protein
VGDAAFLRGQPIEAELYYREALAILEKLSPGSTGHAEVLAALAAIARGKGDLEESVKLYEQALDALDRQTARLGGSNEVRAGFRAKHEKYYRDYLDLLLTRAQPERAFAVLERSRARILLETLATAHVDIRKGADPTLLQRQHSLQAELKAKSEHRTRLLSDKHGNEQEQAVEKEINELTAEYQNVEAQIRDSSPAYAALTQPRPLSTKEIQQQLLDQYTLLLEYTLGEERSYVFAVTPNSLQAFALPKRAEIEQASRQVYKLLTAHNRGVRGETPVQKRQRQARSNAEYRTAAAKLSRMVLGPVAEQIKGKRLLIVADGALQYIPFALLPEPGSAEQQAANSASSEGTPLVVSHEIVNLPSASVLAVLRQQEMNRRPAPKAVAVLADPVFNEQDPRVTARGKAADERAAATRGGGRSKDTNDLLAPSFSAGLLTRSAADVGLSRNGQLELPRLRFSRQEADSILEVTPPDQGMKAVDFQANRAIATSPELSQYRIVHFATHGLLDSEHPELSGLVLSLVDKNGKPQEGFLELQDIYNLDLPADLVVLSACETGLGKEISGEGLMGLTRGFMYAGATRVVASLWKVSDAATARLMADFYKAMEKDGLPPAAALRAAQVQMWKQKRWSSPYFWAAFQIQGEWR